MMQAGLVSVTFKEMPCEDVIRHAQAAGLKAIEWHGLDHVPHGDLEIAHRIRQRTLDAGLAMAAYGSYYVLGQSEGMGLSFDTVLQTAEALDAPMIRVWAGHKNPDQTPDHIRTHIVEEAGRVADLAAEEQIKIVLEFHVGTLTQTGESCAELLCDLDHIVSPLDELAGVLAHCAAQVFVIRQICKNPQKCIFLIFIVRKLRTVAFGEAS